MNAEMLDVIALAMFGRTRTECIEKGQCLICGKPAGSFSDHKAAIGWAVMATCEKCQGNVKVNTSSFAE